MAEKHVASEPTDGGLIRRVARHSAVRYLAVGGTSFVIDFGLLWVLHDLAHLPLWLATGAAFLLSFAFNYTVQRAFAFGSESRHSRSLVKYALLVGFNTVATVGIVELVTVLGGGWALGKVISTAAQTVWNYFAYRYLVFVDRPLDARGAASSALAVPDEEQPAHHHRPVGDDS